MCLDLYNEFNINRADFLLVLDRYNGKEKKYDLNDFFDLCMIWYRDVLLVKSSNDRKHIIFTEELSQLKKQASAYSYQAIEHILSEIEHARSRWKSNVNLQLTIETLLLELQKAK